MQQSHSRSVGSSFSGASASVASFALVPFLLASATGVSGTTDQQQLPTDLKSHFRRLSCPLMTESGKRGKERERS